MGGGGGGRGITGSSLFSELANNNGSGRKRGRGESLDWGKSVVLSSGRPRRCLTGCRKLRLNALRLSKAMTSLRQGRELLLCRIAPVSSTSPLFINDGWLCKRAFNSSRSSRAEISCGVLLNCPSRFCLNKQTNTAIIRTYIQ